MGFIEEIAPHAQRIHKEYGILASLVIAQGIHESNWGKSGLAVNGKNLFGIKGNYQGQSVTMKTWEVYNGKSVYVDATFRKYPSWYESLQDLANLYLNGVSWDRNKYRKVVGESDYKKAAKAVQDAGYATDPNYAQKVIKTIESNNLTKYDGKTANNKEEPTPKPKINVSIVDYLDSIGVDSSRDNRKKLAVLYGVKNYSGTESQNLDILSKVKSDKGAKVESPSKPTVKTLFLPKTSTSWRVYPTNKSPVKGNEKGFLNPKKFGGLSYEILANPQKDVYTIQTKDFGKVNIYGAPSTGATIK